MMARCASPCSGAIKHRRVANRHGPLEWDHAKQTTFECHPGRQWLRRAISGDDVGADMHCVVGKMEEDNKIHSVSKTIRMGCTLRQNGRLREHRVVKQRGVYPSL